MRPLALAVAGLQSAVRLAQSEPAFDVASLLRDRRWSIDRAIIQRRLDLLAAELDLDRDRMQGWGLVHALHWGVGPDKIEPDMVECARLLAA